MNVEKSVDDSISPNPPKSSRSKSFSKESYIDKRIQVHSLLEILKVFEGNDKLAKAAIQATGGSGRNDAVNWAVDNANDREMVEQLVQQFDSLFDSSDGERQNEFASQLEIVFDGYLQSLNDNLLTDFMNLHQMGLLLDQCLAKSKSEIDFPKHLNKGGPTLIVCEKRQNIIPQIISLYRCSSKNRLPDHLQVLVCSEKTTVQELEVFILRATLDPECKTYCLAFADDMSAICAEHLERLLFEQLVHETNKEYKLIVFACDDTAMSPLFWKNSNHKLDVKVTLTSALTCVITYV